jgi:aryl-alcohol dehydrogenase-like predicted oxidoreductase
MKRREFLVKSVVGLGSVVLGSQLGCSSRRQVIYFEPYERIWLGRTGIKGSRICFGTGTKGWLRQSNQTRLGKERFVALLRAAYERGVRMFDLADLYGTHQYVSEALGAYDRQDYVLATKIWWRPGGLAEKERPNANVMVERFLRELQMEYIDVVLLHCVESGNWPSELSEQMQILAQLKRKGLIRAHGISCHSLAALEAALDERWTEVVFARINPYGVKMDAQPGQVAELLHKLHKVGAGVVGIKIMGEGDFRDSDEKRDRSVEYVLGLGCVDVLNVGFEKVDEIDDLAVRIGKVVRRRA